MPNTTIIFISLYHIFCSINKERGSNKSHAKLAITVGALMKSVRFIVAINEAFSSRNLVLTDIQYLFKNSDDLNTLN